MSPLLARVLSAVTIVMALGCSAHPRAAGPDDVRTVTTQRTGDSTFVSITQGPIEKENSICASYCERLASCWDAVLNADVMLRKADVVMNCKKEQHDCRTPTTDALCCGEITACSDFVQCQAESREVAVECSEVRHRRRLLSGDPRRSRD